MANQRKATKVHIGGYFEESLRGQIRLIARARRITVSALIEELLIACVDQYKKSRGGRHAEIHDQGFLLNEEGKKAGKISFSKGKSHKLLKDIGKKYIGGSQAGQ